VVENSCLKTFDSRLCKGSVSAPFQSLRSIVHRLLLLLYSLLHVDMRPKPLSWKYRMALPLSSGSSHCWLTRRNRLLDTTPSLYLFIGDFFATTRCSVPEFFAFVLSPSCFSHLWLLRLHRSLRFPRSAQPPRWQAQATFHAGCHSARKQVPSELCSRSTYTLTVSTSSICFSTLP
jgi:hypothetical protein